MTTAENLIRRSINHTDVAIASYTQDTFAELREQADDYVVGEDTAEFWGRRDAGEWRVHLRMPELGAAD